jgi:hypothetical protein
MSEFKSTKDLIDDDNVVRTYQHGKYVCFVLKNGFTVKLDPNKAKAKGSEAKRGG